MHFNKQGIKSLHTVKRLKLINSVTGIKSANLIGTISKEGNSNLAIFSSLMHLGSNPALLGFILRPKFEIRRHTYENIIDRGFFTVNNVHQSFVKNAHYTSAKFERGNSEFDACNLTEEYKFDFPVPFVKESSLKLGLKFEKEIPIDLNDTLMIIGSIEHISMPDEALDNEGSVLMDKLKNVGISGLNHYYALNKIASFPYARPHELPEFS